VEERWTLRDIFPIEALGVCTITGTNGNDILIGTRGDDVICGFGGNGIIVGRGGDDRIFGGAGNDAIFGSRGNDALFGEIGDASFGIVLLEGVGESGEAAVSLILNWEE